MAAALTPKILIMSAFPSVNPFWLFALDPILLVIVKV